MAAPLGYAAMPPLLSLTEARERKRWEQMSGDFLPKHRCSCKNKSGRIFSSETEKNLLVCELRMRFFERGVMRRGRNEVGKRTFL